MPYSVITAVYGNTECSTRVSVNFFTYLFELFVICIMFIWILCSTYFCSWKVIFCSVERNFISAGRFELGSLLEHIKSSRVWTSTSINICDQLNIIYCVSIIICYGYFTLSYYMHDCSTCFCEMNFYSISYMYLLKLSFVWKGMLHTRDGIDWIAVFLSKRFHWRFTSDFFASLILHGDNFRERDAKKSKRKRHI